MDRREFMLNDALRDLDVVFKKASGLKRSYYSITIPYVGMTPTLTIYRYVWING